MSVTFFLSFACNKDRELDSDDCEPDKGIVIDRMIISREQRRIRTRNQDERYQENF